VGEPDLVEKGLDRGVPEVVGDEVGVSGIVLDQERVYRRPHRHSGGIFTTVSQNSSMLLTMSMNPPKSTGFVR